MRNVKIEWISSYLAWRKSVVIVIALSNSKELPERDNEEEDAENGSGLW